MHKSWSKQVAKGEAKITCLQVVKLCHMRIRRPNSMIEVKLACLINY